MLRASWQPKVAAIAAIVALAAQVVTAIFDGDPLTTPPWNALVEAILAIGLFTTRQNKVTSEAVGAK